MKPIVVTLVLMSKFNLATAGPSDEATIIGLDGKGGLQLATKRNGVLDLQASKNLLDDHPVCRTGAYPHAYQELKVGDCVEVHWGGFKKVCLGIRIIKRGGQGGGAAAPDK